MEHCDCRRWCVCCLVGIVSGKVAQQIHLLHTHCTNRADVPHFRATHSVRTGLQLDPTHSPIYAPGVCINQLTGMQVVLVAMHVVSSAMWFDP